MQFHMDGLLRSAASELLRYVKIKEIILLIETKNLKTRKATELDTEFLAEIQTNECVQKYTGGVLVTFENTVAHIKKHPENLSSFNIIELKETGVSIGILAVIPNSYLSKEEILISLLPDYWGKGYGPELLSEVKEYWLTSKNLTRMFVTVAPDNKKSISMLKKEGFTFVEEYSDPYRSVKHVYKYEKNNT